MTNFDPIPLIALGVFFTTIIAIGMVVGLLEQLQIL